MKLKAVITVILLLILSSCASSNKLKNKKPSWVNDKIKVSDSYLIVVGRSGDFGNKSWQMAEMDAHKTMAKAIDVYVDVYRQTVKRYISENQDKESSIKILKKVHITSKAFLSDLEIVKNEDENELMWHDEVKKEYFMKIRLNLKTKDEKLNKKIVKELPQETQEEAIKALKTRSKDAHKRLNDKLKNMTWE